MSEVTEELLNDFKKIIVDMVKDILTTFPEYEANLNVHLKNIIASSENGENVMESVKFVYSHCKKVYPERFFDILYQNTELFTRTGGSGTSSTKKKNNTEFLPGIDFSLLWKENITDNTRETIWKYLQLVLFTIVSTMSDGKSFGDTAKLFEAINEEEFKSKLEDTISQMQKMFDSEGKEGAEGMGSANSSGSGSGINLEDLPNPSDIQDHVSKILDGKLGKLAKEIAEETASELNIDMENATSVNDVFKKLFQNPTKLMGLVKNVGSKLDTKMKSGDIKESELLQEASEILQNMKNMPGMGNLQSMMAKMGMNMGGASGGGKMNMGAMQNHINQNLRAAQQRDRMRAKLAAKQQTQESKVQQQQAQQQDSKNQQHTQAQAQQAQNIHKVGESNGVENLVFSTGEKVEKSSRTNNENQPQQTKNKKKNKNKK